MSRAPGLSGTVWAIHPKPLDDEVLSSWMVRLARVYEIKPVWFWRLFWMVDFRSVDREPPAGLLHMIAEKTATSFERTLATTLAGLSEEGYGVARNRRYCRECLATDPEPYFRRQWQLRPFLLCDVHGIPLSTGCYRRGHNLTPELVPLERDSVAWCLECDEDLRIDSGDRFTPCRPAGQVLGWQKRLWVLIRHLQRNSADGLSSAPHPDDCLSSEQIQRTF